MHHKNHCKDGKKCCPGFHFTNHVAVFFVLVYIVCFVWYFINPVEQAMHLAMFKMSFLWFSGMNFLSFLSGLVQIYIWGYLAVLLWYLPIYLCGCRKNGKCCK